MPATAEHETRGRVGRTGPSIRAVSIAGVLACLAVFAVLRVELVRQHGETSLDRWVSHGVVNEKHESWAVELAERVTAAPGSRMDSLLVCVAVGAWAWFRRRDLRWGALLIAAFLATTATVAILKIWLVRDPFDAGLDRAYVSLHAADTAAVFGMMVVLSILARERRSVRVGVGAFAVAVVTLVAFSVIVAGHHWLTDVIGGLAIAGAWIFGLLPAAYAMWRRPEVAARLQKDRASRPPEGPDERAAAEVLEPELD
jgi:membrane-associated phospholipid phosphatase